MCGRRKHRGCTMAARVEAEEKMGLVGDHLSVRELKGVGDPAW
jgi:hypothetical protein